MMDAQLRAEIDEVVEKLRVELYQKVSCWSKTRTPSELFDFEQEMQTTLNMLQSRIVGIVLRAIHRDTTFVIECQKQAWRQRGVHSNGWREVSIQVLSGKQVQVKTPYAKPLKKVGQECKEKKYRRQGIGIYPVLRRLGIVRRATPRLLAEASRQIADGPSGAEAEERLTNREIMLAQISMWHRLHDFASIALYQRQLAVSHLDQVETIVSPPLAGERVVVGLDGGRLRLRINKKRDNQIETRSYTTDKCEPKLFAIYTIDQKGNKKPKGEVTYDGTLQSANQVFAILKLRLMQLGIEQTELLVIIGDGSSWIWKGAYELRTALGLGKVQVVEIVDYFHAVGKLTISVNLRRVAVMFVFQPDCGNGLSKTL
jgi:hypothetical protein